MAHRGIPEPSRWRKLCWELLASLALGAVLCTLFIIGDLLVYGHVNW